MTFNFKYVFVRSVEHSDFGGYTTTEVLDSGCFNFEDFDGFADRFVSVVLSAAGNDLVGRGVRVYSFFELFGVLRTSFREFVESGEVSHVGSLHDQTSYLVPSASVKCVELYYEFHANPNS